MTSHLTPLRRRLIAAALSLSVAGTAAACDPTPPTATSPTSAAFSGTLPRPSSVPGTIDRLGVFVPLLSNGTIRTTPAQVVTEAKALTADTVRLEQNMTKSPASGRALARRAGLDVVLTARNDPQLGDQGKPTVFPPHTAAALATFRANLDKALSAEPPAMLAVENEEVGSPFVSGDAKDYLAELGAAIAVGHAHRIPVTNGGIVSGVSALLTWQDLFKRGPRTAADDFARRAFVRPQQRLLLTNLLASTDGSLPGKAGELMAKGHELVAAYAKLPLDYVNFHWYIDDDRALRQTVEYLRRATGHPVITNEIGQYTPSTSVVKGHLATLAALGVPVVIWFDADGDPAVGLHDEPGQLRPTGKAFVQAARSAR